MDVGAEAKALNWLEKGELEIINLLDSKRKTRFIALLIFCIRVYKIWSNFKIDRDYGWNMCEN